MRRIRLAVLAIALSVPPATAAAQDDDADRYLEAFDRQSEALAPHRTSRTRGLVLAPSNETPEQQAGAAARVTPSEDGYVRMPEEAQINIRIEFEFDSAVVRPDQYARLEAICAAIGRSEIEQFLVYGHTDATGTADYNLRLSRLRAEEVRRLMVSRCGLDGARLRAVGVGERHPLDGAAPDASQNRRVEFQVVG